MLRRTLSLVVSALLLPALPSLAGPPRPTSLVRSSPLGAHLVDALTAERMVGVTWTAGSPTVRVRWHTTGGWTAWETAEDDTGDSDVGTPGTAPLWRPRGADRVEVRTAGTASGLRLVRVLDGLTRTLHGATAEAATGTALLGPVRSRADWGADESQVRRAPSYAGTVSAVVVHHTANANGYAQRDVPALIRADFAYHVQTRGWSDLGYNLLVDAYGGIWEGRRGGLGRATVGSHAQGFNTGTLGVAVLGDYTQTTAGPATERALARVVAYAASTWHFDPRGTVTLTSKGSPRYAAGRRATLHRVFGHQETGRTACPGSLQQDLPEVRLLAKVAMGPAPVLSAVRLTGVPLHAPTPAVLDARLSLPADWRATLSDPQGALVATTSVRGTRPHLEWDGLTRAGLPLPALPGSYRWTVTADDGFHPAVVRRGSFDVGLPLVG